MALFFEKKNILLSYLFGEKHLMQNNIQFNSSAVRAGECVSQGWSFISSNFGLYIGMTAVLGLLVFIVGLIPFIGGIVNQFLLEVLICGMFIAILANARNENADFSMLFEGFSFFGACALLKLIELIPTIILSVILYGFMYAVGMFNFDPQLNSSGQLDYSPFGNSAMMIPFIILYLLILLVWLVIKVLLIFALPLIADRNLGAIEAISLSVKAATNNLGGLILLVILEILLVLGGFVLLCFGLLFTYPIVLAAEIAAYKAVFPDNQSMFNNEPPRPDQYGGNFGMPQNFQ